MSYLQNICGDTRRYFLFLLLGWMVFLSVGCKQKEGVEKRLVVFAAASLRDAFIEAGEVFEREHPGVDVVFNFAGTQELRAQIEHGARADVFASADAKHMDALRSKGYVQAPDIFARNSLVIVVARERAADIRSVEDLMKASRVVLGAPDVPIGRYTKAFLDKASAIFGEDFGAKVEAKVVSRELNVKQVVARVVLGEAEVGIVYRTDVKHLENGITTIEVPSNLNVVAEYPIAIVSGTGQEEKARAWVEFLQKGEGQKILLGAGFLGGDL